MKWQRRLWRLGLLLLTTSTALFLISTLLVSLPPPTVSVQSVEWHANPSLTHSMGPCAFVTLLTSDTFLPGSLVLLHSLQAQFKKQESETSTDSSDQIKRDFVVLVLDQVSVHSRQLLMDHGALVHEIVGIASPWPDRLRTERQLYNFSKLRLWELVHYEKVVFLDSDMLVVGNLEGLFTMDTGILAAVSNYNSPFSNSADMNVFNSGMMVLKPSVSVYHDMLSKLSVLPSYNGGDQGFLNEYFKSSWKELPMEYNVNKLMIKYDPELLPAREKWRVIHYVRSKPWFDPALHLYGNSSRHIKDYMEDYADIHGLWLDISAEMNLAFLYARRTKHYRRCTELWRPSMLAYQNRTHFCFEVYPNYFHGLPTIMKSDLESHYEPISLVVQASDDRLGRLLELAREWTGYLSVALWIPQESMSSIVKQVLLMGLLSSRIRIHFVTHPPEINFYPINYLRNVAILHSITDMIIPWDIDFIPSYRMHERLTILRKHVRTRQLSSNKHVFVIPAFEWNNTRPCSISPVVAPSQTNSCYEYPTRKEHLVRIWKAGHLIPFHFPNKGHLATKSAKWIHDDRMFYVHWEEWYEPYILVRKSQLRAAPFDERFFDRGHNKIVFNYELHARGFRYVVLPDVFAIHRLEPPAVDKKYRKYMRFHRSLYNNVQRTLSQQFKCWPDAPVCGKTRPDFFIMSNKD